MLQCIFLTLLYGKVSELCNQLQEFVQKQNEAGVLL